MRMPSATDALARWLVLTLAGVGLFALIPGASRSAPGFAATRWLLALHPVQVLAVVMIVLAWVLFAVHVIALGRHWIKDPTAVILAAMSVLASGATVVLLAIGALGWAWGILAVVVAVHIGLSTRIQALGRKVKAVVPAL